MFLYFPDYLLHASATRSNRGIGVRQKVTENGKLPSNWKTFLRCSENKSELFPFISKRIVENFSKLVITTVEENVICNQQYDLGDLMPCNMEEADDRMLLHVNDASKYYSKHLIKTVDRNIVVISITVFQELHNVQQLWIEYGSEKHVKFIPIHEISNSLGSVKSRAV